MKTLNLLKIAFALAAFAFCAVQATAQTRAINLFSPSNAATQRGINNPKIAYLGLERTALTQLFRQQPNTLQLALPYRGETITLDLEKTQIFKQGFYILEQTAHGIDTLPYVGGAYYRGKISGAHGKSMASVSVFSDNVVATFSDERGTFTLGAITNKLPSGRSQPDANNYVLFNQADVPNPTAIGCFTNNNAPDAHDIMENMTGNVAMQRNTTTLQDTVRIYLEADHTLFNSFGSTQSTVNYVTSIFNAVSTVYANEQISLELAPIFVWATPDAYSSGSPSVALEEFISLRTTFDGDQAQLLSLNGNGGIAGGFNTFCSDRRFSFSGIETSFAALPSYSWTVEVVSHEFGHCFGSRHTHWCGWAGGAIDGCAGQVEPAPDGSSCTIPNTPANGGTIMSYCHLTGAGINMANGFGPQPGNRIRYCVANRFCLPGSTTGGVSVHVTGLPMPYDPFWSIDGSNMLTKIDIASNVSPGQHTITFATFSGVGTPPTQTITVVAGQITIVNAEYHVPSGRVIVNITGGGGQGAWKYDATETLWHHSGDSVWVPLGLTSLLFKTITGWAAPVLTLPTMVNNGVYTLNANYTVVPTGKLSVHLTGGGGNGRWNISAANGSGNSPWYASDDTLTINANYLYNLNFQTINNWNAPPSVNIYTNPNQLNSANATYTALPSGYIKVNIAGANGQGKWSIYNDTTSYNSGDSVLVSSNSSVYIVFKNVAGWAAPNYIVANIMVGTTNTYNAVYTRARYAVVKVNLVGGDGLGLWQLYNITLPKNSGDTVHAPIGGNNIIYILAQDVVGWQTPLFISFQANSLDTTHENVFTMTYTPLKRAKISVAITGGGGQGQWSLDHTLWYNNGDTATVIINPLVTTGQAISFQHVPTWVTPATQIFYYNNLDTLHLNNFTALYQAISYRTLAVNLTGANGLGQFRVNNANQVAVTAWKNSGDTVHLSNLSPSYRVVYKNISGWTAPVNSGFAWTTMPIAQDYVVQGDYTPLAYGTVKVNLVGANGLGKWRLYDNQLQQYTAWLNSGDTLHRSFDPQYVSQYYVEFLTVNNWQSPSAQYLNFAANHATTFTFHYNTSSTGGTNARLTVHLTGANGQGRWSIDGNTLYQSDDTINVVAGQYVYIYYVNVAGWITPYSPSSYITAGLNTKNSDYTLIQYGKVKVNITGANGAGRWTIDGVTLHASGDTVNAPTNQALYIAYVDVPNWMKPNTSYLSPTVGVNTVNAVYIPILYGKLVVNLAGGGGQGRWTIDNLTLHASGDTVLLPTNNYYYLALTNVPNWITPNTGSAIFLDPTTPTSLNLTYTVVQYSTLKVNLTGANGAGRWRVMGSGTNVYSAWKNSGDTLYLPNNISYYINYENVSGWIVPANNNNSFVLSASLTTLTGNYSPILYARLRGVLVGDNGLGKWRINSVNPTAWHNSNDTLRLNASQYINVEFKPLAGFITPQAVLFSSLHTATENVVYGEYIPAQYYVFTGLITGGGGAGQWRIDSSVWHNSGDTLHLVEASTHTIDFKNVANWFTPSSQYLQIYQNQSYTGFYTPQGYGTLKVNLLGAVGAGRWSADGGVTWYSSGDTLRLPTGTTYAITYKAVSGLNAPSSQNYTPTLNHLTVFSRSYTPISIGILKVSLIDGDDEGLWTIGNGYWYNSDDTLHLSTTQTYNIAFSNVPGWVSPPTMYSVALSQGQTTTQTGTYTRPPLGVLQVGITGGDGLGRWSIDNGIVWHLANDTLHLPVGQYYYVTYKTVQGWQTPSYEYYSPIDNQTTVLTGIYSVLPTGTLQVNLTGANGLGQWTIDNGTTWHNSGESLLLNTGTYYYIDYKAVSGWITPSYTYYYPVLNQTTVVLGEYLPIEYGTLQVLLSGGNNQGNWSIDNGATWYNSNDTLHLPTNLGYTIYYKNVAGWITPSAAYYYPIPNQTTLVVGEYLPIEYGTLQVLLSGGNNQGRWSIDNGTTWHISNDTLHLPTNNFYYVTYKTVSGWIVPNYASYHPIANQTTLLVGNYYLTEYGILKVNIVGGGGQGQWSPNNGTTWYNSGDTARLSTNTYYYITFKTVSGWITPPYIYHQPVANQTAIVTGTYTTPQYGILKVNIIGGGGQGQWSADNGATWHNSGDTLHLATNNSYYIYFKNVAGYNTPYYQYYTPVTNQTTTLTGTYTVMPYATLKVNLTGASGQGLWSLDQLVWHASGDTLHLYDTYTYIYFKPVAGWIKPIVQSVNLYANQTTTTVGTYSMHVGTEVNSPQFDFAIMPNPANDYLRCVSSSNETVTPLELRLFNTLGILVYQTSLSANDDQRLDTSTYPAGFYFLQLYDPRSKAFVIHKVIIEH